MGIENSIVVNQKTIQQVEKKDKLFALNLKNSKKEIVSILRKIPGYSKLISGKMREGDIYIAKFSKEAREGLANGSLEKMLKNKSQLWNGMIRKPYDKKPIVEQAEWDKIELSPEMLSNLNQISLQASVAELTEMIFELDQKLEKILFFQQTERLSKVVSGIQYYKQASYSNEPQIQKMNLSNAIQTLNEARAGLMLHLDGVIKMKIRDSIWTDRLWKLIKVDKKIIDLRNEILKEYDLIKADIKYINLSSSYLFRSYTMMNQVESAQESKTQFLDYCTNLVDGLKLKSIYLPYEEENQFSLEMLTADFEQAKLQVENSFDIDRELMVELNYEEIING